MRRAAWDLRPRRFAGDLPPTPAWRISLFTVSAVLALNYIPRAHSLATERPIMFVYGCAAVTFLRTNPDGVAGEAR